MRALTLTFICTMSLVLIGAWVFASESKLIRNDSVRAAALDSFAPQGSAPGWSRGQQLLAITYDECVRRAPQAVQAERYRIDYAAGAFAVGVREVHTTVVMCNAAPEGKTWVNIVVASNGDGGGIERQRLQAQMEQPGAVSRSGCGLGTRWDESEEGWTGVWTRRGSSNVFDVRATKEAMTLTAVQTINISGNRVSISRTQVNDGNDCEMEGTIGPDGVTVTGTYRCKSGSGYTWKATIVCP